MAPYGGRTVGRTEELGARNAGRGLTSEQGGEHHQQQHYEGGIDTDECGMKEEVVVRLSADGGGGSSFGKAHRYSSSEDW